MKVRHGSPAVDVVIVHYNAPDALAACLRPLCSALSEASAKDAPPFSLVVIDNDHRAPATEAQRLLDETNHAQYLPRPSNDGFGTASNLGAKAGTAPYILFLNPDCLIDPADLKALFEVLDQDPEIVAVGPRIERPDGSPEISWAHHPSILWEAKRRRLWKALGRQQAWALAKATELVSDARDVDWLTAACLLVRRDPFEAIGGFDESYFLYFEDSDLGLRLGKQGRLRFYPSVKVCHRGGASTAEGKSGTLSHYRASQKLYYQKHRPLWERIGLRLWRTVKP